MFRTLNNIMFTPTPTRTDLKKCTTQNSFPRSDDAFFAYSAAAVQYRLGKVKRVPLSKVTLVPNSDHLACHLTCTFMFAPCPVNLYCSGTVVALLISRRRFQDGVVVGVSELWRPGTTDGKLSRSIWRNKADAILKSLGCLLMEGNLSRCLLHSELESGVRYINLLD